MGRSRSRTRRTRPRHTASVITSDTKSPTSSASGDGGQGASSPSTAKGRVVRCKDCQPGSKRPAPHPGPRCATHHREFTKAARRRAQETRVERVYGITAAEYDAIKRAQMGRCYACRRATGRTRRLSVDHDHALGDGRQSVRALLCRPCNDLLGDVRDSIPHLERLIEVLRYHPAQRIINPIPQEFEP